MEIQKTTGIVLSSKKSGEADVISTILTRGYGKKKFIFKGLKKSKKRSLSVSEPGSIINLVYYYKENKNLFNVNESSISRHYSDITKNLDKIYHLYYLLESVEKTTGYDSEDSRIFDLLISGIDALAKNQNCINLTVFFILHLLRLQGILPNIHSCRTCGSSDFQEFSLEVHDLSLTCENCKKSNIMLNRSAVDFIKTSFANKFNSINHSDFCKKNNLDLLFYLTLFLENYFHSEIKSKDFVFNEVSLPVGVPWKKSIRQAASRK